MKAVVVGSGGWGTALSIVLCDNGHDVTLWSHNPAKAAEMERHGPAARRTWMERRTPRQPAHPGRMRCREPEPALTQPALRRMAPGHRT